MRNPNEGFKNFLYDHKFDISAIAQDIGMTTEELEDKLNGKEELLIKDAIRLRDSIKCTKLEYLFNYKRKEDLSNKEDLIKLIDSRIDNYFQNLSIEFKLRAEDLTY